MPLTFPSHAAAVLPLWRGCPRLWPAPLIVGSATPDLFYAIGWGGHLSHHWGAFLPLCVPLGLFAWFWTETLLLPALRRSLPEVLGVQWGRLALTRGLPRSLGGWGWGAAAIALGAATHLLWDGFTHSDQWPASWLYPDVEVLLFGRFWHLANLLQHASSVGGLLAVCAVAARRYRSLPPLPPGRWFNLGLLVMGALSGAVVVLALEHHHFAGLNPTGVLWFGFWKTTGAAFVGLTLAAGWVTWDQNFPPTCKSPE